MHVAHSILRIEDKPAPTTKVCTDSRKERVQLWVKRQRQKDYNAALVEFEAEIKEIEKARPGIYQRLASNRTTYLPTVERN